MLLDKAKELIKQRLEHRIRQLEREDWFDLHSACHSAAYHRFFNGYSEIPVLDEQGRRVKIRRIYTGRLYTQQLTQAQKTGLKIGYLCLLFLACFLFIHAVVMDIPCNYIWYVSAAEALVFPGILWLVPVLISYLPANGEFKISEYRSGPRHLRYASLLCAAASAAAVCMAALSLCLDQMPFSAEFAVYTVKLLCSAALFLLVNRLEAHVPYKIHSSGVSAPEGAVEIS